MARGVDDVRTAISAYNECLVLSSFTAADLVYDPSFISPKIDSASKRPKTNRRWRETARPTVEHRS